MLPELQLARQWLDRARSDLRAAEVLLADQPPLCEDAGFHSQQAVEKALKAFLVYHQVDSAWTHQISPLLQLCAEREDGFARFVATAVPLTEYAVRFCYPFSGSPPSLEQARAALETAREVYAFVLQRLPKETHPPTLTGGNHAE
jgi:HEPN domain-containing protein